MRIAHERVLESWQRAKRFLAAEKFFFQTRSDIESLHLRWKRRRSLGQLIPLGPSLKAASELRRSYGDELPRELSAFIDRSVLRGKLWNVAYWVVAGVLLATAGAATWLGLQAAESSRVAEKNYAVARDQVDSLIQQIANQFDNTYGLWKDVVTAILTVIQRSFDQLSRANLDPALRKSRADMLYRFAKIYRKTGQNDRKDDGTIGPAEDAALKSFAIRDELAAKAPGDAALQGDLADAHELLGDVHRDRAFDIQKDKALFEAARDEQKAALAIRGTLLKGDPKNRRWRFGMSYSDVRLGDLDFAFTRGKPFEEARLELEASLAKYRKAAEIAEVMSLDFPGDAEVRKEVAFTLQKIGDGEGRLKEWDLARAPYERSACIRTGILQEGTEERQGQGRSGVHSRQDIGTPGRRRRLNEYAQALSFKSLSIAASSPTAIFPMPTGPCSSPTPSLRSGRGSWRRRRAASGSCSRAATDWLRCISDSDRRPLRPQPEGYREEARRGEGDAAPAIGRRQRAPRCHLRPDRRRREKVSRNIRQRNIRSSSIGAADRRAFASAAQFRPTYRKFRYRVSDK